MELQAAEKRYTRVCGRFLITINWPLLKYEVRGRSIEQQFSNKPLRNLISKVIGEIIVCYHGVG